MKKLYLFVILLFTINIISSVTYSDCSVYGNCISEEEISSPIIPNGTSSNNTFYWQGYTPSSYNDSLFQTYVPYNGAIKNVDLGEVNLNFLDFFSNTVNLNSTGLEIFEVSYGLSAGQNAPTFFNITGGLGGAGGNGSGIRMTTGNGGSSSTDRGGDSGSIIISTGTGGASSVIPPKSGGNGGDIILQGGSSNIGFAAGGKGGSIKLITGAGYSLTGTAGDIELTTSSGVGTVFGNTYINKNGGLCSIGTATTPTETLSLSGNFYMLDNNIIKLGTGKDVSIKYNASDLLINPQVVGSGILYLQSEMNIAQPTLAGGYKNTKVLSVTGGTAQQSDNKNGSDIYFKAGQGNGVTTSGRGGNIDFFGGDSSITTVGGKGGTVTLKGGDSFAQASGNNGGNINITGGLGADGLASDGNGGDIYIYGGGNAGGTGTIGNIYINANFTSITSNTNINGNISSSAYGKFGVLNLTGIASAGSTNAPDVLVVTGGAITSGGGAGGNASRILLSTGNGRIGTTNGVNSGGGLFNITTGNGGGADIYNGGNGGDLNVKLGDGGATSLTGGSGGTGGGMSIRTGNAGTPHPTGDGTNGGNFLVSTGIGGDTEAGTGGNGGDIILDTGRGGTAPDGVPGTYGNVYLARAGGQVSVGTSAPPAELLTVAGNVLILSNTYGFKFGGLKNALLFYNGSDMIINPAVVGNGKTWLLGNVGDMNVAGNIFMNSSNYRIQMNGGNITSTGDITPSSTSAYRQIGGTGQRFGKLWITNITVFDTFSSAKAFIGATTNITNDIFQVNGSTTIQGNLNVTGNVVIQGNISVKRPYAMFSDNTTQGIIAINTPQPVNFSTTENNYLISISPSRRNITVSQTGIYKVELSAIMQSTTPSTRVQIWIQKNGVDVPRSNTIYDFKGANANTVIAVPFIISMNMTDNFRVMMAGDNTGIKAQWITNTSYSPETPSIIMTIDKISELT